MSDVLTEFLFRVMFISIGVCIGIGISIAASFGTFEAVVTALLSSIVVLLANYLGD